MIDNLFAIEQNIMNCWNVCDDIDVVLKQLDSGDKSLTDDELANALVGLRTIYQWKFEQLQNSLEDVFESLRNQENPEPKIDTSWIWDDEDVDNIGC